MQYLNSGLESLSSYTNSNCKDTLLKNWNAGGRFSAENGKIIHHHRFRRDYQRFFRATGVKRLATYVKPAKAPHASLRHDRVADHRANADTHYRRNRGRFDLPTHGKQAPTADSF